MASSMNNGLRKLMASQLRRINSDSIVWGFPLLVAVGWLVFPALDYDWKMVRNRTKQKQPRKKFNIKNRQLVDTRPCFVSLFSIRLSSLLCVLTAWKK
jgi:hypothetical protein